MMSQRERAIEKVMAGFMKKLANFDNELVYDGSSFRGRAIDASGNKCLAKITGDEARAIIDKRLEEWVDDGSIKEVFGINVARCPVCGEVNILDALSRKDNKTNICSDCGTAEAMAELFS